MNHEFKTLLMNSLFSIKKKLNKTRNFISNNHFIEQNKKECTIIYLGIPSFYIPSKKNF